MVISTINDNEAFFLMLELMFRYYFDIDEKNIIEYLINFCNLNQNSINTKLFKNKLKNLLSKRLIYLKEIKYIEIKLNFKKNQKSLKYSKNFFYCVIKGGLINLSFYFNCEDKKIFYLPIQTYKISESFIRIQILKLDEKKFLKKNWIRIAEKEFSFQQIDIIQGYEFDLILEKCNNSRKLGKKIVKEKNQNKKSFEDELFNAVKDEKNMKNNKKLNDLLKQNRSNILFNEHISLKTKNSIHVNLKFEWCQSDPYSYLNILPNEIKLKNKYLFSLDKHLILLKYIVLKKNHHLDSLMNDFSKNKETFLKSFENFFGSFLQIILKQNLFEGFLNNLDHLISLKLVFQELEKNLKIDKNIILKFYDSLDKENKLFQKNIQINENLPFEIKKNLSEINVKDIYLRCKDILKQIEFIPQNYIEKRLKNEKNFDLEKMELKFLDDFDLTSKNVNAFYLSFSYFHLAKLFKN